MKRHHWLLGAGAMTILAAGCAPLQEKAVVEEIKTPALTALTQPASLRTTYIVPAGSNLKYCAEPSPDTALDSAQKLAAEIKAKVPQAGNVEGSASLQNELTSKVVQLAGRTQLILLAREMLYRACELSINNPGGGDQAVRLYTDVAQLVRDLAAADKAQAAAELAKQSQGSANATDILRQLQPTP